MSKDGLYKRLKFYKIIESKKTYILQGKIRKYVQWDSQHGEWEVYNSFGKHIAVSDDNGNFLVESAVKGRSINVS